MVIKKKVRSSINIHEKKMLNDFKKQNVSKKNLEKILALELALETSLELIHASITRRSKQKNISIKIV